VTAGGDARATGFLIASSRPVREACTGPRPAAARRPACCAGRRTSGVAGPSQSFFGEQRFFALAAARPQSRQMNLAFSTSGLSFFRSILPRQQVIAHNLLSWELL
jgi:hypothetical protein